ncbi:MAG: hypothetical protein JWR52_1320 [Marmoricola sp.]|nr:hypothetical protein [Marmoricola sp.]
MNRTLAGLLLAAAVVIGVPTTASAATQSPAIFLSSTSYSGQPHPFSLVIFNNLDHSTLSASISNPGASGSLSCRPAGAINGLGPWRCSLGSGRYLSPGSVTVSARASGGGQTRSSSASASVSSNFGVRGSSGSVQAGQPFTVSGSYDHISGLNDFHVQATVTTGGSVVLGQSGTPCSTSGSTFTCALSSSAGVPGTYSIRVSESGSGTSRSGSASVQVLGIAAPGAPSISGPASVKVGQQPVRITGTASGSGQRIQLLVDPPKNLDWAHPTTSCTTSGTSWSCTLPTALAVGQHRIVARAIDLAHPDKISGTSSSTLSVKAAPAVGTPTPTPTATPTPSATPTPVQHPTPRPGHASGGLGSNGLSNLLVLLVLALAVVSVARPRPLSRFLVGSSAAFSDSVEPAGEINGALIERVGRGDHSPSWEAFGHDATDFWSRTAPPYIARWSPFFGRLAIDGTVIRAIFGSLWWLMPIGGVALGITAAHQTHGHALPPTSGLLALIVFVAAFDAVAGFMASLFFGLLVAGHLTSHGAAVILLVGFLWTGLPLIATLIRPLRRSGDLDLRYGWDRLGDVLITAVICGWVARAIAAAMDGFAGQATGIPAHAGTIGVIAGFAIGLRVLLEHLADLWYPERLRHTSVPEEMPEPALSAEIAGIAVRVAVFAFLGHVLIGGCWQWYAGVLLFALPDLMGQVRYRTGFTLPAKVPFPTGITQILALVIGGTVLVAIAISGSSSHLTVLRIAFVAAGLAPAVLGSLQTFRDEEHPRPATSWELQFAGAGVLVISLILAIHGYGY